MHDLKFELQPYHRDLSEESLIQDVMRVAKKTGRRTVTMREYESHGNYNPSTLLRRFGSWFRVLEKAGLTKSRSDLNIPDEELFDNIKDVWITLGRQPRNPEFKAPLSRHGLTTYCRRFGSWRKALGAFVEYIGNDSADGREQEANDAESGSSGDREARNTATRTRRNLSERLRFRILLRDGFACQSCGASPLKSRDVELHVDHIVPWSQGGETVPGNLQTKCSQCNLGKGNAYNK